MCILAKGDSRDVKIRKYNAACKAIDALIADLRKPLSVPAPKKSHKENIRDFKLHQGPIRANGHQRQGAY